MVKIKMQETVTVPTVQLLFFSCPSKFAEFSGSWRH